MASSWMENPVDKDELLPIVTDLRIQTCSLTSNACGSCHLLGEVTRRSFEAVELLELCLNKNSNKNSLDHHHRFENISCTGNFTSNACGGWSLVTSMDEAARRSLCALCLNNKSMFSCPSGHKDCWAGNELV